MIAVHSASLISVTFRVCSVGYGRQRSARRHRSVEAAHTSPRCRRKYLWQRRGLSDDCPPATSSLVDGNGDIKCVLLELDGGLCEKIGELYIRAVREMFAKLYDTEVGSDEVGALWRERERDALISLAEKFSVESFDVNKAEQEMDRLFEREVLKDDGTTNVDLKRIVQDCLSAGALLVVLSNAASKNIAPWFRANGIEEGENWEIVNWESAMEKQSLLGVLSTKSIRPNDCIAVATTLNGVRDIRGLGIECVGIAENEEKERWIEAGASAVYSSTAQVNVEDIGTLLRSQPTSEELEDITADSWLGASVNLPGNITTDRRSVIQAMNLGIASFCAYIVYSRSQALSMISPKTLINVINPFYGRSKIAQGDGNRVEAFKRFIADVEGRGGGQEVREFPTGADWFNAPRLSLKRDLSGKMIVLDFWTYCCINCMHVIPDLAYIEQRFARDPVEVIGVHSAKFDNEKDSEAIRNAVLRYDINHPVINDTGMVMWRNLGVSSWPTLMVLSPKGQLLFTLTGEGHRQDLDDLITAGLEYYGPRDLLDSKAVPMAPEKLKDPKQLGSNLRFPGKVESDLDGNRLFISDSNNHRIVVTTLRGDFVEQIGGNGAKLIDGPYTECCFNRPQGLCYDGRRNALYVADTENHALRKIDLGAKTVVTLAGNGYQGRDYKGGQKGMLQQLSSPWDISFGTTETDIFIAMAGQHQIWRYDLKAGIAEVFSGNGAESNKNGTNGRLTSWAQPSGLALLPGGTSSLVVADSESSSIRKVDLQSGGSESIAGGDPFFAENLFRYGDKDGKLSQVLLQHPLGVLAVDDHTVYIADSYNHKIKICDFEASTLTTVVGTGVAGYADGKNPQARLSEPGGITFGLNNTLYVADTNNNLIRIYDPLSHTLSTLELKNIPKPRVSPLDADTTFDAGAPSKVIVSEAMSTMEGEINVTIKFPRGFGFTEGATNSFTARVANSDPNDVTLSRERGVISINGSPNLSIGYTSSISRLNAAKIQIGCKVYYCEKGKECLFENVKFEIPLAKELRPGRSVQELSLQPVANTL